MVKEGHGNKKNVIDLIILVENWRTDLAITAVFGVQKQILQALLRPHAKFMKIKFQTWGGGGGGGSALWFISFRPSMLLLSFLAFNSYAVVTPSRKAASYEQRKTNLGSSP